MPAKTSIESLSRSPSTSGCFWIGDRGFPDHLKALELADAWKRSKGSGIRIAVLDSGVAPMPKVFEHIERYDWTGKPISPGDAHPKLHGTRCASLIASSDPEALGVAPEATLVSILVAGSSGRPLVQRVLEGFASAERLQCDVISCSFTIHGADPSLISLANQMAKEGTVIVTASGNEENERCEFPELLDGPVVVGALDDNGLAFEEQRMGKFTDVFAPGWHLSHRVPDGVDDHFGMTSGATALVSGAIALALSTCPQDKRRSAGARMNSWIRNPKFTKPLAKIPPRAPKARFIAPGLLFEAIASLEPID